MDKSLSFLFHGFSTHATLADKTTPRLVKNKGIKQIIRMSMRAICLADIPCRETLTTKDIHLTRNNFQMRGIYARMISAKMVNLQTRRNRAYQQFIGKPMCFVVPPVENHPSIASLAKATTHPNPTRCPIPKRPTLIYIGPEAFFYALFRPSRHNKTPWHWIEALGASQGPPSCTRGLVPIIPRRGLAWG